MSEEPEASQPVVETDENDTVAGKGAAVVNRGRATPVYESSAVDPNQHRELLTGGMSGAPDIQIETVFCRLHAQRRGIARKRELHTVRAIAHRVAHSLPLCHRLRRLPTQLTDRWLREGDAFEGNDFPLRLPSQLARVDGDR